MGRGLRDEAKFDYAVINRQAKRKQDIARKAAESELSHYGQLLSFEEPLDKEQETPLTYSHGRPQVIHVVPLKTASKTHKTLAIKGTPSISDLEKKFDAWERAHHAQHQPAVASGPAQFAQAPRPSLPTAAAARLSATGEGGGSQGRSFRAASLAQRFQPPVAARLPATPAARFAQVLRSAQADLSTLASDLPPPPESAAAAAAEGGERLALDEAQLRGVLRGAALQVRGISALAADQHLVPRADQHGQAAPPRRAPAAPRPPAAAAPRPPAPAFAEGAAAARPAPEEAAAAAPGSLLDRFHTWQHAAAASAAAAAAGGGAQVLPPFESAGQVFSRALARTAAGLIEPAERPSPAAAAWPTAAAATAAPPAPKPAGMLAREPAGAACRRLSWRLAGRPATLEGECSRTAGCAFDFGRQTCLPE